MVLSTITRNDIPADYALLILDYDQETGELRWRSRPREHFATVNAFGTWNARWAGMAAGSLYSNGYRVVRIDGRDYKAHRIIWLCVRGEWPIAQIDHINGIRDDNRYANLREATNAENQHNSKRRADNTSGVKGVHWSKSKRKWRAEIQHKGKRYRVGYFDSKAEAAAAVALKRAELHGEFGRD